MPPRSARQGQLIREFMVAHQLLSTRLNRALAPVGLSLTHVSFLSHLAHVGEPVSPSQLALAMEVNQPAVSKTMKHLESVGAVDVAADETDARRRSVQLTATGHELLRKAMIAMDPAATLALEPLDDDALAELTATLASLARHLDGGRR